MVKLSIVSPVYRAETILSTLVACVEDSIKQLNVDYELILVEDCSPDNSWNVIEDLAAQNQCIVGIKLSRNFGQHIAITAGLEKATGDWIVVLDCDLQDNPGYIPHLFRQAISGYDVVLVQRKGRKDHFAKRLSSLAFYKIFSYLTHSQQDSKIGNYGIYHRKVIDAVLSMGDYTKYFPAQVRWVGFKQIAVPFEHAPRHSGSSSYSFRRLTALALNNVLSFSDRPLRLAVVYGMGVAAISFLLGAVYLVFGITGMVSVSGFVSVITAIFFATGSIIMVIGIVGLYVGKTFEVAKNRPIYIIDKIA